MDRTKWISLIKSDQMGKCSIQSKWQHFVVCVVHPWEMPCRSGCTGREREIIRAKIDRTGTQRVEQQLWGERNGQCFRLKPCIKTDRYRQRQQGGLQYWILQCDQAEREVLFLLGITLSMVFWPLFYLFLFTFCRMYLLWPSWSSHLLQVLRTGEVQVNFRWRCDWDMQQVWDCSIRG